MWDEVDEKDAEIDELLEVLGYKVKLSDVVEEHDAMVSDIDEMSDNAMATKDRANECDGGDRLDVDVCLSFKGD
ncbi:hypothetical protein L1887_05861 [Cichorium endivia]|nr:hypothetical protein L1887_05861 [Cichorium endivia]